MDSMKVEEKDNLIRTIIARFGDLHEYSLEELTSKSVSELSEIASRDSVDLHR